MSIANNDSSQLMNSDIIHESFQTKNSMSTSLYSSSNNNEQKDMNNSTESIISSIPPVLPRTGKVPIGTRVFPLPDSNGDGPPYKLRHFQAEKKGRIIFSFSYQTNEVVQFLISSKSCLTF
jgi:hypothetical protein